MSSTPGSTRACNLNNARYAVARAKAVHREYRVCFEKFDRFQFITNQLINHNTTCPMKPTNDQTLYSVRVVEHVRIPMPDGVELDATLHMPETDEPLPAIFEYLPYRKDDLGAGGARYHHYIAQHGYVSVRLDVRGTGSADGTAIDEYSVQEQLDGVEAIAWMARQPWCTGKVGMFGTSYGGFNSLQVAMHRPPALKALCPMYFTDNRYTDDCHYKGGAMQMLYDMATYGLSMVVQNSLPPYYEAVGERWAQVWEDHLKAEPWLLPWESNHVYNDYWKQGSLSENYAAITAATFLIGGWRDGYMNCNLRTFEHLQCPKKLLVGPWLHARPDTGVPGPRIDHIHEMMRWYDYWLKGIDDGVMAEPPVCIYVQEYDPPQADRPLTSGFWRYESGWPLARASEYPLYLAANAQLQATLPPEPGSASYEYNPTAGTSFGLFSAASPHILPMDQRVEDAYSLNWTSEPLSERLEILGYPEAVLDLAVTTDVAFVVVRLIDIAPDGQAALVTKGVLNLTHRDSHEQPEPLEPGKVYTVKLQLDATSWVFAPGHRIRVSINGADYPNSWPSPKLYTGHLYFGGSHDSRLILPVVPAQTESLPTPQFLPPPQTPSFVTGSSERPVWRVTRDYMENKTEVHLRRRSFTRVNEKLSFDSNAEATTVVFEKNPARATIRGLSQVVLYWPERTIDTRARGQIESDEHTFHVTIQLDINMDGAPFHQRRWIKSIPRRLL
jgi:putative CocE/NonD family hydrolase